MAMAKRSSGGMSGWLAAALLLLAVYASMINDDPEPTVQPDPVVAVEAPPDR